MDKTNQKLPPLGEDRRGLRVTLIQMDIKWGDIAANCATASQMIDSQPGSDLYVLPEMFSTGFATEPEGIADDSLQSLTWMQQKANETNAAIAGSVATKCEDGTYRNRFYFVKPAPQASQVGGCLKNELSAESPTQQNILSHPPTWGAWGAFDAIIYVASWPTSRIEPWRALLKARAIENQCYVLAVDRIGTDPACEYCGGTEIIDAYGRVIEACPDNEACTITTEIDMDALTAFRKKFPVLNDADF